MKRKPAFLKSCTDPKLYHENECKSSTDPKLYHENYPTKWELNVEWK